MRELDATDKKILKILQSEGQISNLDLAEKVALSPSPCSRRVKALETEGYIKGYVALLNPKKINLNLKISVNVALRSHESKLMEGFEKTILELPEVTQCYLTAGQAADYLLKVVVKDLDEYQSFLLKKLTKIEGVTSVQSVFLLKSVVNKNELPLSHA